MTIQIKAFEQYFPVLTFEFVEWNPLSVTIQAIEQYFPVLTFQSVDETL